MLMTGDHNLGKKWKLEIRLETNSLLQAAFNGSMRILLQLNWITPSHLFSFCVKLRILLRAHWWNVFLFHFISVDLQGCVHRFHFWGVGMPGPCPEDLVQGCGSGDPQEPAVSGWASPRSEVGICPGVPLHVPSVPFEICCFSRQEYWRGLPFPSPEDLPHPGIEPRSSEL